MICHRNKCIFIHIPRCGGTSIEVALVGRNWWEVDKTTQHLIGSTAKKIYKPYWDDYFKFSFVRNPWDRMISLCKYSHHYKVNLVNGKVNFNRYFNRFYPLEIDIRSKSQEDSFDSFNLIENSIYLNTLNVELDFIGKLENFQEDFNIVCDKIGIPQQVIPHRNRSNHKHYTEYYDDETREIVAQKYAKDIEYFGYEFNS